MSNRIPGKYNLRARFCAITWMYQFIQLYIYLSPAYCRDRTNVLLNYFIIYRKNNILTTFTPLFHFWALRRNLYNIDCCFALGPPNSGDPLCYLALSQGWAIPGFGQQYYTQYYTRQKYAKLYNTLYQYYTKSKLLISSVNQHQRAIF